MEECITWSALINTNNIAWKEVQDGTIRTTHKIGTTAKPEALNAIA